MDVRAQQLFLSKGDDNWRLPLYELLLMSADLQCTDLQHKLYATMHLASDYVDGSIQVDCTETTFELLLYAIEYHIKCNKNIEFLLSAYSLHVPQPDNTYGRLFPTWFPCGWLLPQRSDEGDHAHVDSGARWSNV